MLKQRFLSMLLSLAMVLSLVPVGAWAEEPLAAEEETLVAEGTEPLDAEVEEEIETAEEDDAISEESKIETDEAPTEENVGIDVIQKEAEEVPLPQDETLEADGDLDVIIEQPGEAAEDSEDAVLATTTEHKLLFNQCSMEQGYFTVYTYGEVSYTDDNPYVKVISFDYPMSYNLQLMQNDGTETVATTLNGELPFKGWSRHEHGWDGIYYQPGDIYRAKTSDEMEEDQTNDFLYAQWSELDFSQVPVPTRAGYVFDGWYTSARGGERVAGIDITSWWEWPYDGMPYSNTYYAHWKLKTPVLTGITNTTAGVKVSWKTVKGAEMYRVYRKTGSGDWIEAGDTTETSLTDKKAVSGKTHSYKVRAFSSDGSSSAYSAEKKIKYIAAPKISKVENVNGGVKLTWGKISGAAKYRLYRKAGSGSWEKIRTVTGTSYTDKTVVSGTKYAYKVRCIASDGTTYSAYGSASKAIKYVAAPVISKLEKVSSGGVKVTWGKVTGAEKYRVFRKTGTGSWTKLVDTTSVTYTDKTAAKGKTYSYTVRCLSKDGKTYTSAYNTTGKSITR